MKNKTFVNLLLLLSPIFLFSFMNFDCGGCNGDEKSVTPTSTTKVAICIMTTDGGNTWDTILTSNVAKIIYAVHVPRFFENTILCAGKDPDDKYAILRTTDAGNDWWFFPATNWLYSIASYPAQTYFYRVAVAVGENGLILKSTNGGENWAQINSPTTAKLEDVDFYEASLATGSNVTALAVGDAGIIIRTTDQGETWAPVLSGTNNSLRGVCALYPELLTTVDTAVAVGHEGTVLISTDVGLSWVQQPFSQSAHLKSVAFSRISSSGRFGITVGIQSGTAVIYKTTDGGVTWTQKSSPAFNNIPNLTDVFINTSTGNVFAIGNKYVLKSADAGETWTIVYTGDNVLFNTCWSGATPLGNTTIVAGE